MADLTVSPSSTNGNNEDQFSLTLPEDLLNHVATFLSYRCITRVTRTCHSLQKACHSNIVWKAFAKRGLIDLRLCKLAEKAKVQEDNNEVKQEESTVQKKRVNSVRDFVLFHENLEKQVEAYLRGGIPSLSFEDLPYLSVLCIWSLPYHGENLVDGERLVEVLQACKNLKILQLMRCRISSRLDLQGFPNLECVDVSHTQGIKLVNEEGTVLLPKSIKELSADNCGIQGRFNLQEFSHLESVNVSENQGIELVDKEGTVLLSKSIKKLRAGACSIQGRFNLQEFPHLEWVNVSENRGIKLVDEAGTVLLSKSIRILDVSSCEIQGRFNLQEFPHLKYVDVSENRGIELFVPEGIRVG